ncbi:MAG: DUF302 domain-containing protein [Clostridia bacterium]|nr:DUF302 domain-containing protein [Clostridia bacterium]
MDINYIIKTDKSFEEAVESLKAALTKAKFGVLYELNFKDKLKEKNLDFNRNFKVLEVCNPFQAKKVLDEFLEAGFFLPCKMVVYEENDSVFIGMPKPTMLISMVHNDKLSEIAGQVEDMLRQAVNEAV